MNLAALPSRAGASLVTVIGVATVIAVMLSLLGVGDGVMQHGAQQRPAGPGHRALSGATELMGSFSPAPTWRRSPRPRASRATPTAGRWCSRRRPSSSSWRTRPAAGPTTCSSAAPATSAAEMNRRPLRMIAGRAASLPGLHELIVGQGARSASTRHLDGRRHGRCCAARRGRWSAPTRTPAASTRTRIVADADTVLAAFNRTAYQSVSVRLEFARRRSAGSRTRSPAIRSCRCR